MVTNKISILILLILGPFDSANGCFEFFFNKKRSTTALELSHRTSANAQQSDTSVPPTAETITTALAANDFETVIKTVRDNKIDLNKRDGRGRLPLVMAAELGYPVITRLLSEAGAGVKETDISGKSALQVVNDKQLETLVIQLTCHEEWLDAKRRLKKALTKLPEICQSVPQRATEASALLGDCAAFCTQQFSLDDKPVKLPCEHYLHKICQRNWIVQGGQTCPTCRSKFPVTKDERAVIVAAKTLAVQNTQREAQLETEINQWCDANLTCPETTALLAGAEFLPPALQHSTYE